MTRCCWTLHQEEAEKSITLPLSSLVNNLYPIVLFGMAPRATYMYTIMCIFKVIMMNNHPFKESIIKVLKTVTLESLDITQTSKQTNKTEYCEPHYSHLLRFDDRHEYLRQHIVKSLKYLSVAAVHPHEVHFRRYVCSRYWLIGIGLQKEVAASAYALQ